MDFEILICGSDVNAYYMARCTHEAYGKKAYMLIKDKLAFTTYSKIINHIYDSNIWNEEGFVNAINLFCNLHSDKKIVAISSNETYADFLVKNRSKFPDNLYFNYPDQTILENLINKEKFYKNYSNMGLEFPKTIYYSDKNEKLDVTGFMFPIIVKPANVVLYNHISFPGKKKIYKLDTEEELLTVVNSIMNSDYNDTIIIQEYIPGDDSHLFDSVVYCDKLSRVKLVSFAQIGLQEHNPNMIGNAAVLINGYDTFNIDKNDIVENIKLFMERINYSGFAEFDLKFDERDKKFKVLEINARQGRCSYYVAQAGYNLVNIMVDDLINDISLDYNFVDKKVMLSFVNKKIIKKYVENKEFRSEALKMYKQSVNPLFYRKDLSIHRLLLMIKRSENYKKSYRNYKW